MGYQLWKDLSLQAISQSHQTVHHRCSCRIQCSFSVTVLMFTNMAHSDQRNTISIKVPRSPLKMHMAKSNVLATVSRLMLCCACGNIVGVQFYQLQYISVVTICTLRFFISIMRLACFQHGDHNHVFDRNRKDQK